MTPTDHLQNAQAHLAVLLRRAAADPMTRELAQAVLREEKEREEDEPTTSPVSN